MRDMWRSYIGESRFRSRLTDFSQMINLLLGRKVNYFDMMNKESFFGKSEKTISSGVAPSATSNKPFTIKNNESAHIGVSTNCAHWFALRTTYGREKKAYDYFVEKGVTAFYPTITGFRLVDGKRKAVVVSRLPNIFFAYGTEEYLQSFVYDNVNLPFLRFYYRQFSIGRNKVKRVPMIIPKRQMDSLMIICGAEVDDVFIAEEEIRKFRKGQLVRVTSGEFAGVIGRVTRFKGQQRVGLYIDGLLTVATAFVPSKYIEPIADNEINTIDK